ncbi:olfactory receptor 5AR1-like [Dendrobates tinctorius]|uniref:olfactory receptor 5AR1-like n=1 Tax=Dendrobates tinctorius TaxID=92724 RepID=UPI003CCA47DF
MDNENKTQASIFLLTGLTDNTTLAIFLFIFFLLVYIVTVVSNVGLFAIVYKTSALQTPMYYFLSYLSLVDLFYSSTVVPKMISDLIAKTKAISFQGCALQFFVFATLAGTDLVLLSNMSYDRYVAICHPLHYVLIMTKKKCLYLVLNAFFLGFMQSAIQINCIFGLQFCGSNLIDHFYCDVLPLFKLSCSDISTCEMITHLCIGSFCIGSLTTILVSYIFIMFSILKINSTKGRIKAFSTCSSHLICASVFFVSVFCTYLRPSSDLFNEQDKVASIFYSVMTPMLNPLIYSLRNKEVKSAIKSTALGFKNIVHIGFLNVWDVVNGLPALKNLWKKSM